MSRKRNSDYEREDDKDRYDSLKKEKKHGRSYEFRDLAEELDNIFRQSASKGKSKNDWMARRDEVIARKFVEQMERQLNEFYEAMEAYADCT